MVCNGNGVALAEPDAGLDPLQVERLQQSPVGGGAGAVAVSVDASSLQHASAIGPAMRHRIKLQAQLVQQQALVESFATASFSAETLTDSEITNLLACACAKYSHTYANDPNSNEHPSLPALP